MIQTLKQFGINAKSQEMPIGIWVKTKKIASIGVRIRQGITSHGIALNVNNDLEKFQHIISCGIKNHIPTSISNETNQIYSMDEVATLFAENFSKTFDLN